MQEPLPLATIHDAILSFLKGRGDAVLFGAQAVNAYVDEPRMTQDVDVLSTSARELVNELREHLAARFHLAFRVREIGPSFRLYQVRKPRNRHLVDVRQTEAFPSLRTVGGLSVLAPEELIATKVVAYHRRQGRPKSGTDWRDLAVLLLAFPDLKRRDGPVAQSLEAAGDTAALALWSEIVEQEILPEEDEEEFF